MLFEHWFGVLFGAPFEMLVTARAHSCEIDGWALGGMQVTARAYFCKIDGRVLGGMQFSVLAQVLFRDCLGALGVLFGGAVLGVLAQTHDGSVLLDGYLVGGMQFGVCGWSSPGSSEVG